MTHRAEQIVDAVVALIQAQANTNVNSGNVYAHRTLTLADDQGEMPAITVNFGEDAPFSDLGSDNLSYIDSLLHLSIVGYAIGNTEQETKSALLNQRRRIHQALLADDSLGLTFVVATRYGGVSAPEMTGTTENIIGSLESRWAVHYRMNMTDPGDA